MALVPGLLSLLATVPLALTIGAVHWVLPNQQEAAVAVIWLIFGSILALSAVSYVVARRGSISADGLGLVVLGTIGVLLVSIYLYQVSFYVRFPADLLTWSESDFVNDILKFRVHYPLYTAQQNNESFIYPPGSQLLTYVLAWLTGNATSIPAYRAVQLGYTVLAAVIAFLCWHQIVTVVVPAKELHHRALWSALALPVLFLFATNPLTAPFVADLHNDSLSQLASATAYWLLLKYSFTRGRRLLVPMAVLPAIGFLVKQNFVIWAVFYCGQLALVDRPFSIKRLTTFAACALAAIVAVVAGCYLLWGDPFVYWIFTVLGKDTVSPLRSFQHILDAWIYLAVGLFGGAVLLRGRGVRPLVGAWSIWLALFLTEGYTSGIAWMLNHLGPASLIAGVWFLAGLVRLWSSIQPSATSHPALQRWFDVGIAVALIGLLFSGLKVVRIPVNTMPADSYRYVSEIDHEFQGQNPESILLDMGTWVYLDDGVVMKDRVSPFGDRGINGTGDFSGMIDRLDHKQYAKILVHNLYAPDFWYDDWLWPRSSHIREALLANYHEVGRIKAVSADSSTTGPNPYGFTEISILVPNSN